MKKITIPFVCLLFPVLLKAQDFKTYPMWNSTLPVEKRVKDLVGRLTLEEKVAQMLNTAPAIPRLGIPAYEWWNEVLHGVARTPYKTTVFPQAIGMAATWDTNALKLMAQYSGTEGRAINNKAIREGKTGDRYLGLTYWTPNINIFRDPRWGRGQETYGEDPFLTAKMGSAFVKGLQGDDPNYLMAAACAKHYAVHSGPEASRHSDNINPSLYDLWDTYLPAFKELVVKAKVAGVMCAYNAINDQPCCANDLLMNDILRRQWKFAGYVTSDCGAIDDFVNNHKTHKNAAAAAADAVFHGTDVECGDHAYRSLVGAVKTGIIAEKDIDVSLSRLFTIRYRLGMFDPAEKVKYRQIPENILEAPAHKEHALKMARESIVLLKNSGGVLPLLKSAKHIAVIGPNADNKTAQLGNYNGFPSKNISVLEGIKEKLGPGASVFYDKGVGFTTDILKINGNDVKTDMASVASRAAGSDVIVFVGGISPELEGEEMSVNAKGFKGGDRTSILLPAVQTEMLKQLQATGKPVILVLFTGSALAMPWETEHLPAIINAWYGGQSTGTAVADVLFGDYNPAGRLPVTFYKSDADLPDVKDYSMKGRTYRYFKGEVEYPFGYGLSYSTFKYSNLKAPAQLKKGKTLTVEALVTNTSKLKGEEVVQLYVSHPKAKGMAPVRALAGFQRINLEKGESKKLRFELSADQLMLVDENGKRYEPDGKLLLSIGGGQPDVKQPTSSNVVQHMVMIVK
ncbi:glycoside hydrolase family 3 C-terminal domain-containing protein [Pedobacter nutrimenti]|uniref:glycoside hydrolase family 3 C-terminal domain-containing protein n=1 Tax=Pedobacter nutrimenti TaxID=1241337 RepID=UPI0029315E25|nr:glycoside hydrolase family 3 C-terminal domain-containing protein [Pedobacter nutrimenti]